MPYRCGTLRAPVRSKTNLTAESFMIRPSIGRKLWFWRTLEQYHNALSYEFKGAEQPEDASVCYVHSDTMVNLSVVDPRGEVRGETSVTLVQEGEAFPPSRFCTWVPFQVGQARAQQLSPETPARS